MSSDYCNLEAELYTQLAIALSRFLLQPFGYPDFDDGLTGNAETLGFFVQRVDHPDRKVHIDPPLVLTWTGGPRQIKILGNVLTRIELFV